MFKDGRGAADVDIVPIQSRCPSCGAAVPTGAAWCSLCHADLRPRREPVAVPIDVTTLPSEYADVAGYATPSPEAAPRHAAGRHSKDAGTSARAGRRQAPRTASRQAGRAFDADLALEGIALPTENAAPGEVEEVADMMLARLAMTEPKSRMLNPSDLPGGKWGVVIAGGATVLCVMLILFTVLGSVFHG